MSLFDHSSQGSGRFGRLSANMFFIRNTAKPKRVRHIEGSLEKKRVDHRCQNEILCRIEWCIDLQRQ